MSNHGCCDFNCGLLFQQTNNNLAVTVFPFFQKGWGASTYSTSKHGELEFTRWHIYIG